MPLITLNRQNPKVSQSIDAFLASETAGEIYILVVPGLTRLLGVCTVYHHSYNVSAGASM